MACGDKYKYLIVTADGYTLDNKYGWYPYAVDYTGWKQRAAELMAMAIDAFDTLGEIEEQRGSYPKWNPLVPVKNNLVAHFDELEDDWHQITGSQGTIEEINKAAQVASEAVCLLEMSNNAITFYGDQPTVLPDITPTPAEEIGLKMLINLVPWWGWALVGTGGALLTYGLYQRARGRRDPPPPSRSKADEGRTIARRPAGAANPGRKKKRRKKARDLQAA